MALRDPLPDAILREMIEDRLYGQYLLARWGVPTRDARTRPRATRIVVWPHHTKDPAFTQYKLELDNGTSIDISHLCAGYKMKANADTGDAKLDIQLGKWAIFSTGCTIEHG